MKLAEYLDKDLIISDLSARTKSEVLAELVSSLSAKFPNLDPGRVAQVLDERPDCTVDTHVTIVRPGKQVTTHFYGLSLLAREEYFEQQGVGATGQTELGRGRVAETTFILPPLVVLVLPSLQR